MVLATATVALAAFHVVSTRLVGGFASSRPGTPPEAHLWRRVWGLVLFGALPMVVAATLLPGGLDGIGLGLGDPVRGLGSVAVLGAIAVPVLLRAGRGAEVQAHYPQIRAETWTRRLLALSSASWVAYLIGYEVLFRGFLLFGLVGPLGTWPAIWVVTALYVAVHVEKAPSEVIASVPMGIVFGGLALWTGAVWAPFALHLIIALAGEFGALRATGRLPG